MFPNRKIFFRGLCLLLTLGFVGLGFTPSVSKAEEPVQQFLNELRNQGYYDEALVYLKDMETSPIAPVTFKDIVTYERAKTLLASLAVVRERVKLESILDSAEQSLDLFITEHRTHPLMGEATELFANLLIKRAELNQEQVDDEGVAEGIKQSLLADSRKQLKKANEIFGNVREDIKQKILRIDSKTTDPQLKTMLGEYRVRYMQVRLNLPQTTLLLAGTYPEGAPEREKLLTEAVDEFTGVRKAYQAFQGTFFLATLGLAEGYAKKGNIDDALLYLEDIFELPQAAELRDLKRRAVVIALPCWRAQDSLNYKEILPKFEATVGTLLPSEMRDIAWLELQLELAGMYREAFEELDAKATKSPEETQQASLYEKRAEELVRELTKNNSPLKIDAQKLLASWGLAKPPVETGGEAPTNFLQARDKGVAVLTDYDTARVAAETLRAELQTTNDPDRRAELETQLRSTEQVLRTAPIQAMSYFEMALGMTDGDTPPDDLAVIRRYMAYLYYVQQRYYSAGVLGAFQLRTNPGASGAQSSASIALNAYWSLYQAADAESRDFELTQLQNVADLTLKYFPETAEAIKAANVMSFLSLSKKDLEGARGYLEQIPNSAPERRRAELSIGTQLWSDYLARKFELEKSRRSGELQDAAYQNELAMLQPMIDEARQYLEKGVGDLTLGEMDSSTVNAVLAMCQLYLTVQNAPAAVALLERPEAGLLALVDAKHASVQNVDLTSNVYRTALRAYIAGLTSTANKADQVAKARQIMRALNQSLGADASGQKRLIALYVDLVSDLKDQMESLGQPTQRLAFGEGVASFLEEVQSTTKDPNLLIWSAETMISVAETLKQDKMNTQAKALFTKADKVLTVVSQGNSESSLARRAKVQQARVKKNLGLYPDAIRMFAEILSANPNFVTVQVDAADTYHQWGRAERSTSKIASALAGGEPFQNPKTKREENAIWGWGKLAQVTARDSKFRDIFLQARFNLAYGRMEYALLKKSDDQLARAKRDILATAQIVPDYGSKSWKAKYDALMKALQKELGEPQTGLPKS
ncbi:MAG: hypothetical protein VX500_00980 [Planctomycetota bacterium]|nr:hypothetical protein [Planctomycetota bacterium]